MKLTKFFLPIILAVLFFSCSEDDPTPAGEGIPGTWNLTGIEYTGSNTVSVLGIPVTTIPFTGTGRDLDLEIQFVEDTNEFEASGTYSIDLAYEIEGTPLSYTLEDQEFIAPGTWVQDGDIITISSPGQFDQELRVVEMTENTVVMAWDFEESFNQQGTINAVTLNGTYTFERK
ncbi:MAG: lipocalin family protein [Bacteroidota bacterium]